MKHKSFPKTKTCMKVNETPVWAKHSTGDMSSKEGLHLKALTEHSGEDGNIGIGHTHLRNEDL